MHIEDHSSWFYRYVSNTSGFKEDYGQIYTTLNINYTVCVRVRAVYIEEYTMKYTGGHHWYNQWLITYV